MSDFPLTGGCQCGAVRFSVERLGRPTVCHCQHPDHDTETWPAR